VCVGKINHLHFIFRGVDELPTIGCTLCQSLGFSVGLRGFGNVCNVGGVYSQCLYFSIVLIIFNSFFFIARGRKKQNKFPSNLHCPDKKLNPFYFITIVSVWSSVFTLVANGSLGKN